MTNALVVQAAAQLEKSQMLEDARILELEHEWDAVKGQLSVQLHSTREALQQKETECNRLRDQLREQVRAQQRQATAAMLQGTKMPNEALFGSASDIRPEVPIANKV